MKTSQSNANSLRAKSHIRAAVIGALMGCAPSLWAWVPFQDRWETTATDGTIGSATAIAGPAGASLIQGDPTTLTWGFANEGTGIRTGANPLFDETNTLISSLNSIFTGPTTPGDLTTAPWFTRFDEAYERWDQISGLTMTYEPADDGTFTTNRMGFSGTPGALGVRADLRLGGFDIDGGANASILAQNYQPDNGDMQMDVANILSGGSYGAGPALPGVNSGQTTRLQNVLMHEAGHGLGLNHVTLNDTVQLMEPVVNVTFWGPQLDDIIGIQRLYGDALESANMGNGNDTFGNATGLGTITSGGTAQIGTLGDTAAVAKADTDFISIDGTSDMDFFSFTVGSMGTVDIDLIARGATYQQYGSPYVTDAFSNLQVELLAADGVTVLASGSGSAAGIDEMISAASLTAGGTYFIKVAQEAGAANDIQLYGLDVKFTSATAADGNIWDINGVTAGAGGATPNGNWSGATNWTTENTDTAAGGNTATAAWNNNGGTGNVAVFSAGDDATGTYTVNSDLAGVVLTGLTVEQGNVVISGAQSLALNEVAAGASASGHNQGNANYTEFFIAPGTSLDVQVPLTDDGTANDNLDKTGTGFMQLSATNTYGGRTRVTAGELRINGSIDSNTTVLSGATISGTGTIDGNLDMQAGSTFEPGSAGQGNLTVTGTATFDNDTNLNYQLDTPFATKAAAAQSGDHLMMGGNSLIFDGNLNIADVGGFASGFYELASADDETINFTNDSSDFTIVPDPSYAYRIEGGLGNADVDLVVADTPDVLFATGSNVLNLNLGNFLIGAGGMAGYTIENALGSELLRLFADNIAVTGSSGMTSLFGSGFGSSFDLNGGDSQGLTASFLGAPLPGSYNASYTFGWDDFIAATGSLGNIPGLLAGNGTDIISGDFYLPEDYLGGEITLNLFATVGQVPEPSRALLLLLGLGLSVLRRSR